MHRIDERQSSFGNTAEKQPCTTLIYELVSKIGCPQMHGLPSCGAGESELAFHKKKLCMVCQRSFRKLEDFEWHKSLPEIERETSTFTQRGIVQHE